ncbi:flagellar biosynthetic protein FliQ [candidate division KSB1 bacterium]|nr:flagellar biosynthesis protein FliQ [bacterium]OQX58991.1 MAG: flagellar biosynthetic protein FliQ [candidate division KSB1 bacterium 4484_219]RKY77677.1 MAG: flagellar biosynthetic protein FliQ [candidate division KSB1 bacterium]RKY78630.1 MAG: flagellar biosynthetic protein FliQ [candidate division KSB1 bacterium]RKY84238.1 MAG: flagellar biosynthetic protein FliQ [candidate division KSB1 bacterium]
MTQEFVLHIGKDALLTALLVAAPMLIGGLIVGLAVGIFQAVTQIHEMTLTFVPKILVVFIILLLLSPWMLNVLISFAGTMLNNIPLVAH